MVNCSSPFLMAVRNYIGFLELTISYNAERLVDGPVPC